MNYADLQAAMIDWINHDDASTVAAAPLAISMFESEFIRENELARMEGRAYHIIRDPTNGIPLPGDFITLRTLAQDGNPASSLIQVSPSNLVDLWSNSRAGPSVNYAVSGESLLIAPLPASGSRIDLTYYAFTRLGSADTNWLLDEYPDAYLYGALKHLAIYLKDKEAASVYQIGYERAVAGLAKQDRRARFGGTLQIVSDVSKI